MINSVIYNEEYGSFQYYSENDIITPKIPREPIELAVISKDITFKAYQDFTDETAFNKFLKKAYKDKSYFTFALKKGYGVYSVNPLKTKQYYELGFIDTVIPYEYLITKFVVNEKQISKPAVFIEFQADFIRLLVIFNGFCVFPAVHTTNDTFKTIFGNIKNQLISKRIEIASILSNNEDVRIKDVFDNIDIVGYNTKEIFNFHSSFNKRAPHFENLEVKFEEREKKKSKIRFTALGLSVALFAVVLISYFFVNNKIDIETQKARSLDYKLMRVDRALLKGRSALVTNRIFRYPDLSKGLSSFLSLFPSGVIIKNINIVKSKSSYAISGKGTVKNSITEFVAKYNIVYFSLIKHGFAVHYNFTQTGKPYFNFKGILDYKK